MYTYTHNFCHRNIITHNKLTAYLPWLARMAETTIHKITANIVTVEAAGNTHQNDCETLSVLRITNQTFQM